jgi:hypothetical protein
MELSCPFSLCKLNDTPQNFLKDLNVGLRVKQQKKKHLDHIRLSTNGIFCPKVLDAHIFLKKNMFKTCNGNIL